MRTAIASSIAFLLGIAAHALFLQDAMSPAPTLTPGCTTCAERDDSIRELTHAELQQMVGPATAAAEPVNRVPAVHPDTERAEALEADKAALEKRVAELERNQPIDRMARALGLERREVRKMVDRSTVIPDSIALAQALEFMSFEEVKRAFDREQDYLKAFGKVRTAKAGETFAERQHHHAAVVVPWIHAETDKLCNALYELRCPSSLVTRLRTRLLEGI